MEAFFSQYHEPLLPYWVKNSFWYGRIVNRDLVALEIGPDRRRGRKVRSMADKTKTLTVQTPEGVTFSLSLASPVTRCLGLGPGYLHNKLAYC